MKYLLKTLIVASLVITPFFALAQNESWYFSGGLLRPIVNSWNIFAPADFRFDGDLLPDGADCATGEILKKVGANDWDCATDNSGSDPFTHPSLGISATTSEMRSPTASTTALRVSGSTTLEYLTNGLLKVTDGVVGLASAGSDYLTTAITSLGGQTGGTQTLSKVDDTNVTLTITSSANNHQFAVGWQNTLSDTRGGTGYDSIQKVHTLSGLGSYGSTTATTTAEGNLRVKGNLQVDGILFAPISLITSGPVVINGESKALYHTATSTTVASTFPLASTTAVSIEPGIGQHGLVIRPTTGSCGSIMDIENQFGTDVFNITCAGATSFNTLSVYNSGSTQNQIGGFLQDTTSVTTIESGLTTRSAASFGSPYNSATPLMTFVKTASDDTGNFYRAGSLFVDWVSDVAATRMGKLRLTLNDFNGERDVLTATSTGSGLEVGLANNQFKFSSAGTSTIPYASTTALTVSGAGNLTIDTTNTSPFTISSTLPRIILTDSTAGDDDFTISPNSDYIEFLSGSLRDILVINGETRTSGAGFIGIGTTTPGAQLAASTTAGVGLMVDQRGTSDILRLLDGGSAVVEVPDGGNLYLANNDFLGWRNNTGSVRTIMSHDSSNNINIKTSDSLAIRFLNSTGAFEMGRINQSNYGSLGMGTTSPGAMIAASSSANFITAMFDNRGTSDIARFLADGVVKLTVGRSTTTVSSDLSLVNGNAGAGIPFRYCEAVVYNGSSPQLIYSARDGTVIQDVYWESTTGWAGALGANLKLGDAGDNEGLMNIPFGALSDTTNWYGQDPNSRGSYMWDSTDAYGKQKVYNTPTAINIYNNPGLSTQGAGQVCLTIMELK